MTSVANWIEEIIEIRQIDMSHCDTHYVVSIYIHSHLHSHYVVSITQENNYENKESFTMQRKFQMEFAHMSDEWSRCLREKKKKPKCNWKCFHVNVYEYYVDSNANQKQKKITRRAFTAFCSHRWQINNNNLIENNMFL